MAHPWSGAPDRPNSPRTRTGSVNIDKLETPHSRRALLKFAGAGTATFSLAAFLAACGGDESSDAGGAATTTTAAASGDTLNVSAGGDIPAKTVKFGMA